MSKICCQGVFAYSNPTSAMSLENFEEVGYSSLQVHVVHIYISHNTGKARTHPWGAPEFSTINPFTITRCGRPWRKSLVHSNTLFKPTYKLTSLFSSTYGSTVLTPLEESTNKILPHDLTFSKCCVIRIRRVREAYSTPVGGLYASFNESN